MVRLVRSPRKGGSGSVQHEVQRVKVSDTRGEVGVAGNEVPRPNPPPISVGLFLRFRGRVIESELIHLSLVPDDLKFTGRSVEFHDLCRLRHGLVPFI